MRRPLAIVRLPVPGLQTGERTFVERSPIDYELACDQHAGYRSALEALGFAVEVLPGGTGPDAVFVEDPLLVLDEVVVALSPGAVSRRDEVAALGAELDRLGALGARPREVIDLPATIEGGDVLCVDDLLLVGQSARTNHAGLKRLAHVLLPYGYRIKAAAVEGCLHLKTACTYLGRDLLLANPDWIDLHRAPADAFRVHPEEPFGANVIVLGQKVLMSAAHPRTAERISARGFDVTLVELSEFEKAEAGPTCLSLRTLVD